MYLRGAGGAGWAARTGRGRIDVPRRARVPGDPRADRLRRAPAGRSDRRTRPHAAPRHRAHPRARGAPPARSRAPGRCLSAPGDVCNARRDPRSDGAVGGSLAPREPRGTAGGATRDRRRSDPDRFAPTRAGAGQRRSARADGARRTHSQAAVPLDAQPVPRGDAGGVLRARAAHLVPRARPRAAPRPRRARASRDPRGRPQRRRRARGGADAPPRARLRAGDATRADRLVSTDGLPSSSRAVIVGAGIAGNSLAYHLSRLGWTELVLVDKGPLPNPGGSTGHASNFIFPVDHSKEMTVLTKESARQYEELGLATISGGVEVARTKERLEELRRCVSSAKAWGEEGCELLTPEQVRALVPYIETSVILGGFYSPSVGIVDS